MQLSSVQLFVRTPCVFANILENALASCAKLDKEKRYIHLSALCDDKRMRIRVTNSCPEGVIFEDRMPISQRQGGGIGTRSIVYTAEKYDGIADFSYSGGEFMTQILLNTKKQEAAKI